jgi:Flp pilus assembly protein TadB
MQQPEKPAIHLPPPSFWPIVLAAGVLLMAVGVVGTSVISVIGVVVVLAAIVGWTWENRALDMDQEAHHD